MVSNSHLDTQWRWDVKATIDDYLYNTAVQNLALLEKYPHYVFNFEGAVKYEWIKEYYPHLFERIRKFVADGDGTFRGLRSRPTTRTCRRRSRLSATSCLHRSFIKRSSASSRRICSCPTVRIQPGHADAGTPLRPDRFLDAEIVVAHRAACRPTPKPRFRSGSGKGSTAPASWWRSSRDAIRGTSFPKGI